MRRRGPGRFCDSANGLRGASLSAMLRAPRPSASGIFCVQDFARSGEATERIPASYASDISARRSASDLIAPLRYC